MAVASIEFIVEEVYDVQGTRMYLQALVLDGLGSPVASTNVYFKFVSGNVGYYPYNKGTAVQLGNLQDGNQNLSGARVTGLNGIASCSLDLTNLGIGVYKAYVGGQENVIDTSVLSGVRNCTVTSFELFNDILVNTREFFGRIYFNNITGTAGYIIRTFNKDGEDFTLSTTETFLEDGSCWYQVYALASPNTEHVSNDMFELLDNGTSSGLANWNSNFKVADEEDVTENGLYRAYQVIAGRYEVVLKRDTTDVYLQQGISIGAGINQLLPNTTYVASVWCETDGVDVVGVINVTGSVSGVSGDGSGTDNVLDRSTMSSTYEKISVYFTTDASGTVTLDIRASTGTGTCSFDRVNIVKRYLYGFDEGEPVYLAIMNTDGGKYAKTSVGGLANTPFKRTEYVREDGYSNIDLYFNDPTSYASPTGGTYDDRQTVRLYSSDHPYTNAVIEFTTDGTDPKIFVGTEISSGETLGTVLTEGTTVVKFYAKEDPLFDEVSVNTETYVINNPSILISPISGWYGETVTVTVSFKSRGGTLWYTIDGTDPGISGPGTAIVSGGTFTLSPTPLDTGKSYRTVVVKCVGTDEYGINVSTVVSVEYKISAEMPLISSFTINDGAAKTNNRIVTCETIESGEVEATKMTIAEYNDATVYAKDPDDLTEAEINAIFSGAQYTVYSEEKSYQVSSTDGNKYLYVRLSGRRPVTGEAVLSNIAKATIELETATPAFSVNTTDSVVQTLDVTFTGTKESGSSVVLNGTTVVTADSNTTWSYAATLQPGRNDLVFYAETDVGNKSDEVTREIYAYASEGVTSATTMSDATGYWEIPYVLLDEGVLGNDVTIQVTGSNATIVYPPPGAVVGQTLITVTGTADPVTIVSLEVIATP